jgi:hypothetical protein
MNATGYNQFAGYHILREIGCQGGFASSSDPYKRHHLAVIGLDPIL